MYVGVVSGCLPRACSFASISSLLPLRNFQMADTNTLRDEIPACFVLDFLQTKAALTIKGEESQKSATLPPSGKFRVNSLEPVPMIVLGYLKFPFSH